ncbi:MAG: DUF547 domain-containing protein [Verrucomicrobiota bacterium]
MTYSTHRNICLFLVLSFYSLINASAASKDHELTSLWNAFLHESVDNEGRINYGEVQRKPETLNAAYEWIRAYSPDSHPELFGSEAAAYAYWLNAYNIAAVYGVVRHYPIESVRDVKKFSAYSLFAGGGFFAAQKFEFGGKRRSLYWLENKLIRKRYKDPRLHFALNCASEGCPALPREAFEAGQLEQQLERETEKFVRSAEQFQIDHEARTILISSIYDWYDEDFTDVGGKGRKLALVHYLRPYLSKAQQTELDQALASEYAIDFLEYDWALNDQARFQLP